VKGCAEFLPKPGVIDVGQLAPVNKAVFIAADPVYRLLFEKAVVLPRGFLDQAEIDYGFVPGLPQDSDS
jgi:hypothetical protein